MAVNFQELPHEGIRTLSPYKPGKSISELKQERGLSDIIKLASNENPLGCSKKVLEMLSTLPASIISNYPAPLGHPIFTKLANHLKVNAEQLLISNGSDIIFNLLLCGFALHTNKHLLTHEYAFSTYQIQAKALGIPVRIAKINNDWSVDVNKLIGSCDENTGLVCLANPNNPTGRLISEQDLRRLLINIPDKTLLVLDEAYFEYSFKKQGINSINWLRDFPNLVITRTFSKAYGLAGLRLGYAIANPAIIDILRRLQLPFAVNQAALEAGYAALDDEIFIQKTIELNQNEMGHVQAELVKYGFEIIPSACNFITFHCQRDDASIIYQNLLNEGIIVRPLHPYNMPEYLRVTIGTFDQNTRFLNALKRVYSL